MVKRMLIDATHAEETRVVVLNGSRLDEFDVETSTKKQLKGNIYLAKIVRVEPSLQAAFVDYGGGRHGFLAFNEIHPDYYQIPVADRKALLAEHRAAMRASGAAASADFDDESDDRPRAKRSEESGPSGDPALEGAGESPEAGEQAETEGGIGETEAAEGDTPESEAMSDGAGDSGDAESSEAEPSDDEQMGPELPEPEPESAPIEASGETPDPSEAPEPVTGETIVVDTPNLGDTETAGGTDEADEIEAPRRVRSLRHYKIQEVIKRRQIVLVQVVKEERGTKGAALTTYLSLAGRYCVLMPNTARGGGVSRKITNAQDRKRLKGIVNELEIPDGMAVIIRTAGSERTKPEIKRDYEYLIRLWDTVRELTLQSTAPALVYEEANLIKRSIRDLYARDIDEIQVEGEEGYRIAKDFMRMLTPSHAKKVQLYKDPTIPLFHRFQVESQLDAMHSPTVQLKSGGYIVINQTEALVAIDVNSGRATRDRHIEETALRTNSEAAEEVARQLRLRDLAGLIVIDFIDMEESRNNHTVERRLKEAMRHDRARIQLGRISPFGLLELSRQRLRPSLLETSFQPCAHCNGTGSVRSVESSAVHVLRAIEEEGIRRRGGEVRIAVATQIALYLLNQKRAAIADVELRYALRVVLSGDDSLVPPVYRLEHVRSEAPVAAPVRPVNMEAGLVEAGAAEAEAEAEAESEVVEEADEAPAEATHEDRHRDAQRYEGRPHDGSHGEDGEGGRRRRRRRRRGRGGGQHQGQDQGHRHHDLHRHDSHRHEAHPGQDELAGPDEIGESGDTEILADRNAGPVHGEPGSIDPVTGEPRRRRRRGKRGGRRRNRNRHANAMDMGTSAEGHDSQFPDGENHERGGHNHEHGQEPGHGHGHGHEAEHGHGGHQDETRQHAHRSGDESAPPHHGHGHEAGEHAPHGAAHAKPTPSHEGGERPRRTESEPSGEPAGEPAPQDPQAPAGPPRRGWWNRIR